MGGVSITTSGSSKTCAGFELELQRKLSDRFALSVAGISEGNTELSDRKGVASQLWFLAPELGRLRLSAGLGPYIAQENNINDQGTEILGLASIDAKVMFNDKWYGLIRLNRTISTYDKDGDMVFVDMGRKF